jgi:hypothetical protein
MRDRLERIVRPQPIGKVEVASTKTGRTKEEMQMQIGALRLTKKSQRDKPLLQLQLDRGRTRHDQTGSATS